MIRFVFFDAGETLLRPEPSFPELLSRVLTSRGHDVTPERALEGARSVSGHFRRVEGKNVSTDADASRRFWTALYTDLLDELGIDDDGGPEALFETFSDPASYELFPDALTALEELADAGYRLGVISNFERWLERLLRRLEVLPHFDVVAISGAVGWEKPDPRIFEWAVERTGLPPEACAHVGDQPYFDADAAIDCGLEGILLDRLGRWTDLDVDYPVISGLEELPGVLAGLEARS